MKNVRWEYGIRGALDDKEKKFCDEMDAICDSLIANGKSIYVAISIEGGNQFHIRENRDGITYLIGYMTAEQCLYALKGIYAAVKYI